MISHASAEFWEVLRRLPPEVQRQARAAFRQFMSDPFHRGLRFKCIDRDHGLWSVRVGIHYRAVGVRDDGEIVWYWIGSHSDYDKLTE